MSSTRRHLVNRTNRPTASETPSHRSERPAAVLPTYQAPSCPLTVKAKRELEILGSHHDNAKQNQFLRDGIKFLTTAIEETSELLVDQKTHLDQLVSRREKDGSDKGDLEERVEQSILDIQAKLDDYMVKGEKAVRELIDCEVQNNQRGQILKSVITKIENAPAPAAHANDDGEESDSEEQRAPVLKPSKLLKQAQDESRALYEAKSLRDRYAESNHYKSFKTAMHMAKYGEDAQLPPSRDWFRQEGTYSPGPQLNHGADDSDDDLVMQSATVNTKCPLSMMDLTEPLSNKNCVHVYEKGSFLEYIDKNGVQYARPKKQLGPKQVKCMVPGCDAMISAEDCYEDSRIARKIKRALAEAKRLQEEDSEEDEDAAPPGTQRRKPAEVYDDDDEDSRRRTTGKIKTERVSRGVSLGRTLSTPAGGMDEEEEETGDLEDDDEMDEDTGFADDHEV